MKTLKDFMEVYKPKAPDEQKFVDKHVTIKFKDRNEVGGKENGDDVFNASNIKPVKRKDNRQGYDVGEDEKVYEEAELEEGLGMGYKPTSEKSKFDDGHRAKLLNPDGRVSYLSQKSYATPKHAKDAAKYYHSIGHLPTQTIDNKMSQYNKNYDTKKESVEADEINDLLDEALAILEKTLTPAELKKREEIAKAIGRGNPKMPMPQKMAIATAQAKKVAEEVEDLDEGLMHNRYMRSHGKNARGTGAWAFTTKEYGSPKENEMHFTSGQKSLSDAHKEAAAKLGTKNLYVMEEVEAIDELSKGAMLKYLSANKKNDAKARETGDFDKMTKRMRGTDVAVRKYTAKPGSKSVRVPATEEVEQIDETAKIVAHLQKRYGDNIRKSHVVSAANDFGVDASKLAKAVRAKLGKNMLGEENDDGWYTHNEMHGKVSKENWKKGWRYNNLKDKPFYHQPTKTWHASIKEEAEVPFKGPYRKSGEERKDEYGNTVKNVPHHLAKKAMRSLKKEDIIDRAVSKYIPEELKFTPEERMIKRLEGLREGHIDMLMSLFESLNDVNQSKMIESAETEEGLNQLLDFAINNRGA